MSTSLLVNHMIRTIKRWVLENKDATSIQILIKVDNVFESFVEELDRWFEDDLYKSKLLEEVLDFCEQTIENEYDSKCL